MYFKKLYKLEKITQLNWPKIYYKPALKIIIFKMICYLTLLSKKILRFDNNKFNKLYKKK
jgi:hypothetical protein